MKLKPNKILIIGKGYIAQRFSEHLCIQLSELYVNDYSEASREIQKNKPDVIINCAGETGTPNVDWCESHRIETLSSNVLCPLILLKIAQEQKIYFVHIGSGCIYHGNNNGLGYNEEDEPNFSESYYSRTKIMTEKILKEFNVLQVRFKMPLDYKPHQKNLITKLSGYKKIINSENSISVLDDAVLAAIELIKKKKFGIYNIVNPGTISNAEIMEMYKELIDKNINYEITDKKITKVPRSECALNTDKLKSQWIFLKPIKESVRDTMIKYKKWQNS